MRSKKDFLHCLEVHEFAAVVHFNRGLRGTRCCNKNPKAMFGKSWKPGMASEILQIGVPKEPKDFLVDAVKVGHPRDMIARAGELETNLLNGFVEQPLLTRFDKRALAFKRWLKRSLELKEDEERLHASFPPHLKSLLAGKRLLLWKEILQELNYSDCSVVDDICKGFPLTGWAKKTDVFESCVRKPEHSLDGEFSRGMLPGSSAAQLSSALQPPVHRGALPPKLTKPR